MAVYKVIQDVEAEDKLLGPLSLKSFIYAIIAATCAYIDFRLLFIGSPIKWVIIIIFLLPMLLFGVLASPLGKEQPTEVWLLSRIRFMFKPRLRTWDQEGLEELVTITAPKRIEERLVKDLSQSEVRSRLKTLASTLDTRGWAIKNVDLNLNVTTPQDTKTVSPSDRLIQNAGYTQAAPVVDVHPADDIMDEQNNPTAQKFASLMQDADTKRRHQLMTTLDGVREEIKLPENDLTKRLAKARASFAKSHGKGKKGKHKLLTAESKVEKPKKPAAMAPPPQATAKPASKPATPVTPARQAVNMELAQSGSAFSVATLSQLANRLPHAEQTGPNEVTITLH